MPPPVGRPATMSYRLWPALDRFNVSTGVFAGVCTDSSKEWWWLYLDSHTTNVFFLYHFSLLVLVQSVSKYRSVKSVTFIYGRASDYNHQSHSRKPRIYIYNRTHPSDHHVFPSLSLSPHPSSRLLPIQGLIPVLGSAHSRHPLLLPLFGPLRSLGPPQSPRTPKLLPNTDLQRAITCVRRGNKATTRLGSE